MKIKLGLLVFWEIVSIAQIVIFYCMDDPNYWINYNLELKNYLIMPISFLHAIVILIQFIVMILESKERLNSNLVIIRLYWIGSFMSTLLQIFYFLFKTDVDPMFIGKIILAVKCSITIALSLMSIKWVKDYSSYSVKPTTELMNSSPNLAYNTLKQRLLEYDDHDKNSKKKLPSLKDLSSMNSDLSLYHK